MDTTAAGCRLCLYPFSENFDSIENAELKEQMEKVFHFEIKLKQKCPTSVCQTCSYTISEFYKYSERVRQNQEFLIGCTEGIVDDPSGGDSKEVLGRVKWEPTQPGSDSEDGSDEVHEKTELKEESEEEAENQCASDDSYKPPTKTTRSSRKRKRRRSKTPSDDSDSDYSDEDDEELRPKRKCNRPPKSLEEKIQEERQIQEHYRMVCDICCHAEKDYRLLYQHYKKEHNRKGYLVCCQKKLTSRKIVLDHIIYHTNPNAFRCDQCNKSYKNLEYLSLHKLHKHSSEDREHPFKCDECEKSFPKKCYLNRHKEGHQKIQCQVCHRVLSSSSALNVHMTNMHSDKTRSMVCDVCGQEFLNKICFERHLNEHKGIEVQKLQCHVCRKWYRGERNLQNHIEYTHNQKGREFPCDVCHQNYPNERAMKKHKRGVHVEEKFECEFCGKRFKQSFNLKEHRTTHTGEVLYSCDYCGITKNSRANLYVHVKQKHPQEWAERKMRAAEANAS
ncbi:transcription factor grauzone-like [Ochlerotatus camptorhynchus]|uniref:transcription factor grauzone-like n=1 Tax=Ochlerotatus camptorhynchus TaxID=644619 RepID=UPI0031DAFF8D